MGKTRSTISGTATSSPISATALSLLHIDRLLLRPQARAGAGSGRRAIRAQIWSTARLITPSRRAGPRREDTFPPGEPDPRHALCDSQCSIRLFDLGQGRQRHRASSGPSWLTLPGTTPICGDSHLHHGMGGARLRRRLRRSWCMRSPRKPWSTQAETLPRAFDLHPDRRHAQGHDPAPDRRCRHRRRHRSRRGAGRLRDQEPAGRRPADDPGNLDRDGRARTGMVAPDDITFDTCTAATAPRTRCGIALSRAGGTLPSDADARVHRAAHDRHAQGGARRHQPEHGSPPTADPLILPPAGEKRGGSAALHLDPGAPASRIEAPRSTGNIRLLYQQLPGPDAAAAIAGGSAWRAHVHAWIVPGLKARSSAKPKLKARLHLHWLA